MADENESAAAPTIPPEPTPRVVDCTAGGDLRRVISVAKEVLDAGRCLVLPTDTVYGIAADAFDPAAVQRLLTAKRRGRTMPPPVLIGDEAVLPALAEDIPDTAHELVARHWPGPLTVICRAQPSLRMDLGETHGTIAVRVPDLDLTRDVLRRCGPLAVSSANISGRPPAITVEEAVDQLGTDVALYLDGGPTPGPVPSTIVDFTRDAAGEVLREGVLDLATLRETLPDIRPAG